MQSCTAQSRAHSDVQYRSKRATSGSSSESIILTNRDDWRRRAIYVQIGIEWCKAAGISESGILCGVELKRSVVVDRDKRRWIIRCRELGRIW